MSSEPLVSIITPSFNQGHFLEATIRSILDQDYPHIEYIIMDGGSTDESVEILQRYADRIDYWESQPDRGQPHAINKGLQRARGDIIGWLNSDDVLLSQTVSLVVETFQKYPQVDVVYGRLERIDEKGRLMPTPLLPKDKIEYSRQLILRECLVNQPGSFWRRSIMERAGFLDETLQYSLDYEYWIRLAILGAKFKRLDQVVARFRLSQSSKTVSQTTSQALELLQSFEKVAGRPDLPELLKRSDEELKRMAAYTRARIYLQLFYGEWKQKKFRSSLHWFMNALNNDPFSPIDRRWLDLGIASLRRRLSRWDIIGRKSEADQLEKINCPPN